MRPRSQNGTDALSSMRNCKQPASLEIRALISEGVECLELVKA
jgi:hypothetical protein